MRVDHRDLALIDAECCFHMPKLHHRIGLKVAMVGDRVFAEQTLPLCAICHAV